MNLKKLELLFIFLFLSTSVLGVTSMNTLTKGQADLLYCRIGGTCIFTNLVVQNFTVENITVTNIFINATFIIGLNETIISIGNTVFQPNITAQACTGSEKFSSFSDGTFTCTEDIDSNASTACDDGDYLDGGGLCIGFNATVDEITKSTTYLPYNVTVIYGSPETTAEIEFINVTKDGKSLNVTEASGGNALEIIINFSNVKDINDIILRTWFDSAVHSVVIGLWDYTTDSYEEEYGEIDSQSDFETIIIDVTDSTDHIQNGIVSLRLRHAENGIPNHVFRLDYSALVEGFSTTVTHDHDALSGRNNKNNHIWAMPTDGSRNMTGQLNGTSAVFTDNVGIGTTTPTSELEVIGDINFSNSGTQIYTLGGVLYVSG